MRESAEDDKRYPSVSVRFLALFSVCATLAGVAGEPVRQRTEIAAEIRVLFIGNSLTYWNEMPWMLERIAESLGNEPKVQAEFSGAGGATLRQHWERKRAARAIEQGRWTYVVIQPQSSEMMRTPDETGDYARRFALLARKHGAVPVLFETWKPGEATFTQSELTKRYADLAATLEMPMVPVAHVFGALQKRGIETLDGSRLHPSLAGSYASACTFYAFFARRSPAGAVHRFDVKYEIPESHRRDLETGAIAPDVAALIQREATVAARRMK